jgi:hypothetical protein
MARHLAAIKKRTGRQRSAIEQQQQQQHCVE